MKADGTQRGAIREPEIRCLEARLRMAEGIGQRMNSGMSGERNIERTLMQAAAEFPELRFTFGVGDGKGRAKILCSVTPAGRLNLTGFEVVVQPDSEVQRAVLRLEPVTLKRPAEESHLAPLEIVEGTEVPGSAYLVPLRHPDHVLAFVAAGSSSPRVWQEAEKTLLGDVAIFLTLALKQASLSAEREKAEGYLREARKMEALGQLVGGISHDFNNLLTAMMIYCGLLSTALGKEHRLQKHVEEIKTAGERGAALVAQLLALTRQQVLEPRITSLNLVLEEMQDMLQRVLGEDVILRVRLDPALDPVNVDAGQIGQVVLNLAINARDAMPEGGILTLETANAELSAAEAAQSPGIGPGRYAALLVSDTGHGMEDATLARAFEPFFSTKPKGKGSGLGLATAMGIVKQHDGLMTLESAVGKGTSFRILLPGQTAAAPGEKRPRDDAPSLGRETLLLVEDDDIVRRSLLAMIGSAGYQVLEASHGSEALEISRRHRSVIHLMVTDIVMPGMNGRELAEKMVLERPGLPVLFISGYTDDPRTRALMGEKAHFLGKPFPPAALLAKIRFLLSGNAARDGSGMAEKSPGKTVFPVSGKAGLQQ